MQKRKACDITNTQLLHCKEWRSLPLRDSRRLLHLLKEQETTHVDVQEENDHLIIQLQKQLRKSKATAAKLEKKLKITCHEFKELKKVSEHQEEEKKHSPALVDVVQRGAFPVQVEAQFEYHHAGFLLTYRKLIKAKPVVPISFPEFRYCLLDTTFCQRTSEQGENSHQHVVCIYEPYPPETQVYLQRNDSSMLLLSHGNGGGPYSVDCKTMLQTNLKTGRARNVTLGSLLFPVEKGPYFPYVTEILFKSFPLAQMTHLVDLRPSTLSLAFLKNLASLRHSLVVWHGSRRCRPDVIVKQGFQVLASDEGVMGRGIYGSTSFVYSSAYASSSSASSSSSSASFPCPFLDQSKPLVYSPEICTRGCSGVFLCLAVFDYLTPNGYNKPFVDINADTRVMLDGSWTTIENGVNVVIRDANKICPLYWVGFR